MPHPSADRERGAERRLVDEAQGRTGPSQLDPARDGRPEEVGIAPELGPADLREARRERVVAIVLPLPEDRLERRLPAGERTAHRLGEQLQLGLDREPHAPTSSSTASVSAPSDGAGRVAAGILAVEPKHAAEHRHRPESRLLDVLERGRSHAPARRRAPTRARGPGPRERPPSRDGRATPRPTRWRSPLDRRRHAPLLREHGRIVRHEIGCLDRRVLEPEQREERLPLREVEAGDREEAVGRLVAAVVRVHRQSACDLVGARREIAARRRGGRAHGLAVEPDEILDLHRERRTEERHLDDPSLSPPRAATSAASTPRREQMPAVRSAIGIPPARTGTRVAVGGVRREEPRAALGDEVVGRPSRERPVRAERGDDADDERRMRSVQRLPAEPERRRPRRRRVVDDDVGRRDELRESGAAVGRS